jgi:hypothetical protein
LGSKRALIETVVGRYKGLIGSRLRARSFTAQQTEVAIGWIVLNRSWRADARSLSGIKSGRHRQAFQ